MKNDRKLGPGPWCGTPGGYSNHKCRCVACRSAHTMRLAEYMKDNPEQRAKQRRRTNAQRAAQRARATLRS